MLIMPSTHSENHHKWAEKVYLKGDSMLAEVNKQTQGPWWSLVSTTMWSLCTKEAQIFIRFTLRWAVLELHPFFGIHVVHQMTLTCSRSSIPICILLTPHISRPFCSTMSRFQVMPLVLEKEHLTTPNDLAMFKVKNTNMHATHIPETQIFVHFTLQWAVFDLRPCFSKKCTEWLMK